jgi:hypothetical protein
MRVNIGFCALSGGVMDTQTENLLIVGDRLSEVADL